MPIINTLQKWLVAVVMFKGLSVVFVQREYKKCSTLWSVRALLIFLEKRRPLCLILCSFFTFFVSISFKQALLIYRNYCFCFVKQMSKFVIITLRISLKNRGCFDFSNSLGISPYLIHHNYTSRSSLLFKFSDLLFLFIFIPCFNVVTCFGAKPPLNVTGES